MGINFKVERQINSTQHDTANQLPDLSQPKLKFLVVGGGLSGSLAADRLKALSELYGSSIELVWVEPSGNFYGNSTYRGDDVFLNRDVRTFPVVGSRDIAVAHYAPSDTSDEKTEKQIFSLNKYSFSQFCDGHGIPLDPAPSRGQCGNYIEQTLRPPSENASVKEVQGRVTNLIPDTETGGIKATIEIGQHTSLNLEFNGAVVCLGNGYRNDFFTALSQGQGYVSKLDELGECLKESPNVKNVIIAGSGLSSIDYCHRLFTICKEKDLPIEGFPEIWIAAGSKSSHINLREIFSKDNSSRSPNSSLFRRALAALFTEWNSGDINTFNPNVRSGEGIDLAKDLEPYLCRFTKEENNVLQGLLNWMIIAPSAGRMNDIQEMIEAGKIHFVHEDIRVEEPLLESNEIYVRPSSDDQGYDIQGKWSDTFPHCQVFCDARVVTSLPVGNTLFEEMREKQYIFAIDNEGYDIDRSVANNVPLVALGPGVFKGISIISNNAEDIVASVDSSMKKLWMQLIDSIRKSSSNE